MHGTGKRTRVKGTPNIEVGCGIARGDDSFGAGRDAASQATEGIISYFLTAVIVFAPAS